MKLFPFLRWFPMTGSGLRADIIAGISVAMILVPQSMGYAKLAGLPVVYGLYAAAFPVVIGSMWGSSRYLHTGPVAMLSLLSAASLAPFAAAGTDLFIQLSLMLALMVGVLRLLLGLFKLGILMNFVSHPVMMGFTNAAALIIGLSLLNTFFNVPKPDTGAFLTDFFGVFTQLPQAHWPTILFGLATLATLHVLRKWAPSLPGVLVVVVAGTAISAAIGFEKSEQVSIEQITDKTANHTYRMIHETRARLKVDADEVSSAMRDQNKIESGSLEAVRIDGVIDLLRYDEAILKEQLSDLRLAAHDLKLTRVASEDGSVTYRTRQEGDSGPLWRLNKMTPDGPIMSAGGQVVGSIPKGLPAFQMPVLNWDVLPALAPAAFVMALIGFMEAMSISRALAARHRDNLDPNQELIGQGLANIVGSFFQSYAVSGSFSRSAVAARSGANSGVFAVVSAIGVMVTMLYLTPYLYHLPLAVLAAIVMSAVFGLLDLRSIMRTWKISPADGAAGTLTFFATLYMAPDLAMGVIVGVVLASLLFVISNVRPRTEVQGRSSDGSLAGAVSRNLPRMGDTFVVIRFDGSLEFMNVAHFGDAVTNAMSSGPEVRYVLVLGASINQVDASGLEKVRSLCEGFQASGGVLMFSGLKRQVRTRFEKSGLTDIIGHENMFPNKRVAIDFLLKQEEDGKHEPLKPADVPLEGRLRSG
ncbi:MAG: SulP family inorganic anion transporter [Brevirhabdus sp.]